MLSTKDTITVTQISFVDKVINKGKFERLKTIAKNCGKLREDLWDRYGSIKGWNLDVIFERKFYKENVKHCSKYNLNYKQFAGTLEDTLNNILLYQAAVKVKVIKELYKTIKDKDLLKDYCKIINKGSSKDIVERSELHRVFRKHYVRGRTKVDNQIVLENTIYNLKDKNNKTWLSIPSDVLRKPIKLPLRGNPNITSQIRLIIRDSKIEIHHYIKKPVAIAPNRKSMVGVDRGLTEVFATSDGCFLGNKLGEMIKLKASKMNDKVVKRNKLQALYKKKGNEKILRNNLGKKKLGLSEKKAKGSIKTEITTACHNLVSNYETIVYEDLTNPIINKTPMRKKTKHFLSNWCKGEVIRWLEHIAKLGGSELKPVNPAYTSQVCSVTGALGYRNGDKLYCLDGRVVQSDKNAANNILLRASEKRFGQFANSKTIEKFVTQDTINWILRSGTDCSKTLDTFVVSDVKHRERWKSIKERINLVILDNTSN